jgi:tetratricopeptide (TPR) repeat protein
MPLFGGTKRPPIDGLTTEETKRRDALNPEVLRRAGERGYQAQAPAAAALLQEKQDDEADAYLWPLLLGRQLMSMKRYGPAMEAFEEAVRRDENDVRAYYGAGHAYFQAAEAKRALGDATTDDVAPLDHTVDNLYQNALRNFRRAQELADKKERGELSVAVATVQRAVARKAGKL